MRTFLHGLIDANPTRRLRVLFALRQSADLIHQPQTNTNSITTARLEKIPSSNNCMIYKHDSVLNAGGLVGHMLVVGADRRFQYRRFQDDN